MKLTILYDNTVILPELKKDWGFSCLIEGEGIPTILFDTGGDGHILMHNMKVLGIPAESVEIVFISHNHYDHTGGLSYFLHENPNVSVYVPRSFRGVKRAKKIIQVDEKPVTIREGIFSTGEIAGIEQSLCIPSGSGSLLVTGCSHPPFRKILKACEKAGGEPVRKIAGGFHGFSDYKLIEPMEMVCATHCTQHKKEIQDHTAAGAWIPGGTGTVISL